MAEFSEARAIMNPNPLARWYTASGIPLHHSGSVATARLCNERSIAGSKGDVQSELYLQVAPATAVTAPGRGPT